MKSVLIRLIAGLLLLIVGLFIFIDTMDIYPFKGYYVYECSLCGKQWNELVPLTDRKSCPNRNKEVNPETGKKEYICNKRLCAVGVTDKKAVGNYLYVDNVTNHLLVNSAGGILAITGIFLMGITGYRTLLNKPKKSDED